MVASLEQRKNAICFTIKYETLATVLHSNVSILSNERIKLKNKVLSVWDTGANVTCINESLAQKLKLPVIGYISQNTASGQRMSPLYYISVLLPNNVLIENIRVTGGQLASIDLLIGMDIIGKGDFAVSNYQDKTYFTFRMPSIQNADYVKDSNNALAFATRTRAKKPKKK